MLYQQILIEFWESGGNVWNLVTCDPIISVFIDQEQSLESNSGQIGPSVGVWVAVFQFYGLICDIGCCLKYFPCCCCCRLAWTASQLCLILYVFFFSYSWLPFLAEYSSIVLSKCFGNRLIGQARWWKQIWWPVVWQLEWWLHVFGPKLRFEWAEAVNCGFDWGRSIKKNGSHIYTHRLEGMRFFFFFFEARKSIWKWNRNHLFVSWLLIGGSIKPPPEHLAQICGEGKVKKALIAPLSWKWSRCIATSISFPLFGSTPKLFKLSYSPQGVHFTIN